MFEVAGGVRCREDVAQRRGYSDRSNADGSGVFATGTAQLGGCMAWHQRLVLS